MRLIDADMFAKEMKNRQESARRWAMEATDNETAIRADTVLRFLIEVKLTLDEMPTIEEPVVRCKDCRYRKTPDCPMCEYIRMMRGEDFTVNTCITTNTWRKIDHTTDEDFCSKGKRKEDPT